MAPTLLGLAQQHRSFAPVSQISTAGVAFHRLQLPLQHRKAWPCPLSRSRRQSSPGLGAVQHKGRAAAFQRVLPRAASPAAPGAGRSPRVCVLGAGVVGLTSALRLLQRFPDAELTVFAEKFGGDTTTAGAAGVWQPYKLSETPEDLVNRWGKQTFDHLLELYHSDAAVAAGVSMSYCTCLFLEPEPDPFWKETVMGFHRLSQKELDLYSSTVDWSWVAAAAKKAAAAAPAQAAGVGGGPSAASSSTASPSLSSSSPAAAGVDSSSSSSSSSPTAFVDGYAFNTIVCEGRLYMEWLIQHIKAAGGQLQQRRLSHISELEPEGWDLVINCCGLGAKELVSDPYCYPIRGQITQVRAPWVTQCVFADFPGETAYIIPNREWVVLGGTGQVGDWNLAASLADAEGILERCSQVLPSLKQAEVLSQWVGLRPGRVRLRLELGRVTGRAVQSIGFEEEEAWSFSSASDGSSSSGDSSSSGSSSTGRQPLAVVSNYGHGGSGLTLAWGTAGDAVEIAAVQLAKKGFT